nr:hypothetical protein [Tanacetum cinerariifolium]
MYFSADFRSTFSRGDIFIPFGTKKSFSRLGSGTEPNNFPGVTYGVVMLRVFSITLKGPALRRINILSAGLVTTWDLLEKAFISQYCPPFKTTKKSEEIHNFKQEGFIPLMTPTQALKSIQVIADHSRNLYDEAITKERSKGSSDDVDIKQLDENIHVFQVISKTCKGMHLTEECTLRKEDKAVELKKYMRSLEETIIKFYEDSIKEQAIDDEWIRKLIENTDSNIRELKTTAKNLQKKTYQLTQIVLINTGEKVKARTTMGKENLKDPIPHEIPLVQTYVPPMKFLGNTDDGWDITVKNVDRFSQQGIRI